MSSGATVQIGSVVPGAYMQSKTQEGTYVPVVREEESEEQVDEQIEQEIQGIPSRFSPPSAQKTKIDLNPDSPAKELPYQQKRNASSKANRPQTAKQLPELSKVPKKP